MVTGPKYEVVREASDKVLKINYDNLIYSPSMEDDSSVMLHTIDTMIKAGKVTKLVFIQKEEYSYDQSQVELLQELIDVYINVVRRENILDFSDFNQDCVRFFPEWKEFIRTVIIQGLKEDPIGNYMKILRRIREEEIKQKSPPVPQYLECSKRFILKLQNVLEQLSKIQLIKIAAPNLPGLKSGDRNIYRSIFKPSIRPYFIYTKLTTSYPTGAEELESYTLPEDTEVLILRTPDDIRPLYHITPPEFKLDEEYYNLLGEAQQAMAEHKPQRSEFVDPERTREIFFNIEQDLIADLAKARGMNIEFKDTEELARILLRYTIGFGLVEVLLSDPNIQDIVVNAPLGTNSISIIHGKYGECRTNITPTIREGQSWATKLRLISGRPLDEANPVLDTNLIVPHGRARVAAVQEPLSPKGISYAFRRHRDRPWTLPLFIDNKYISPLAAGVLSFLIDGSRTMLVAGTRSSGKTSLLGSLMTEIMRTNRVITVEDTLELPVDKLRQLKYDIESFKVGSVITRSESEVPAEQGIRTSLRMGDSALIVGEVRSKEALALWEAMRVGALAKTVAGTIHGDSPYGVFDRVVNDLGVPKTSFKATDIIVIANPVTSPSGLESWRRVVQITEVRKLWDEDPLREKGFANLFEYNSKTDMLEPTPELLDGESEIIKAIGGRVREWAGNWEAIWENIQLRTKIKQAIVDVAKSTGNRDLLEADFVVRANDEFHKISSLVSKEIGYTNPKKVFLEWENWMKEQIKRKYQQNG